jgi:hypothetical protein
MAERSHAIPSRKAIAALGQTPDQLEILLKPCSEKDGSRTARGRGDSVRTIVGRLGTRDRHHWVARARRAAEDGDGEPPAAPAFDADDALAGTELAELVTRFRHMRAQSVEFLASLPAKSWSRVAALVAEWIDEDAAAIEALTGIVAELKRS